MQLFLINDFIHMQSGTECGAPSQRRPLATAGSCSQNQTLCYFRSKKRPGGREEQNVFLFFFCFRHQQSVPRGFIARTRFRASNNWTNAAACRNGHFIVKSIKFAGVDCDKTVSDLCLMSMCLSSVGVVLPSGWC